MKYQRQVIDGETVIVRVPDEQATAADPVNGIEAENPAGSYELLVRMFAPREGVVTGNG